MRQAGVWTDQLDGWTMDKFEPVILRTGAAIRHLTHYFDQFEDAGSDADHHAGC